MNMIKVKVKKEFRDKYTGLIKKPGDTMTISDVRKREIQRSGDYIEIVKEEVKENGKG